jgi:hypothetical protein
VFNVVNDFEQVDITHGNKVTKFGEQFLLHTIMREDIFIPRGRSLIMTAFVDASHAANRKTPRSHTLHHLSESGTNCLVQQETADG